MSVIGSGSVDGGFGGVVVVVVVVALLCADEVDAPSFCCLLLLSMCSFRTSSTVLLIFCLRCFTVCRIPEMEEGELLSVP